MYAYPIPDTFRSSFSNPTTHSASGTRRPQTPHRTSVRANDVISHVSGHGSPPIKNRPFNNLKIGRSVTPYRMKTVFRARLTIFARLDDALLGGFQGNGTDAAIRRLFCGRRLLLVERYPF
ncbi:b159 [miniopterid betaherpesvirus 1]|uniref:B159 n=1 Tax=miniopterid betaherpesvirus 1 TaxID=3070189 RepID=I3VQG1_9BETA|nr:b159 [miniopterid betaherpesvirus 1]AFK84005.1 b159 [miniopterid betaherpesvirus 1]